MIDYEIQFVTLDGKDFTEVDARWRRRRDFPSAGDAYRYARDTERRGQSVAFAKHGGTYSVWVGEKNAL